MKKLLYSFGILIFLMVIVGGYFVGDSWGEMVAITENAANEAKNLKDQITRLKSNKNKDAIDQEELDLLNMKLVKIQLQNLLISEMVEKGLIDTLTMLMFSDRPEEMRKMFYQGMLKIKVTDCPEEFQKRFKELAEEFKKPEKGKRSEKMNHLFNYIEEIEQKSGKTGILQK